MGRTRYKVHETHYPYFITSNVIYGIPIFADSEVAHIILDSLKYFQQNKDLKVYAYCIMENHLHLIAKHKELPKCMQGFKSYTARTVVDHLKERNRKHILKSLEYAKMKSKMNSKYQVWEEGYHPKQIMSRKMMAQN